MTKAQPDINDELRENGTDGVRRRHDKAKRYKAGNSGNAPRFRLQPFNNIELDTTPEYLIKDILPRTGIAVVWGPPKCGKSFVVFDLMMHVALGWEYRGHRVQPGAVVYLALEGGHGFKKRIKAWRDRHLAEYTADVPFYLVDVCIDLIADHELLVKEISDQLGTVAPVCVVIDTLNRALNGDENKSPDMSRFVAAADAIRIAFGGLVVVIHHCGTAGDHPRGHTALPGAVETQIAVNRDANDNVITTIELMKDGPDGAVLASRLEQVKVGVDNEGDAKTSCIVVPVDDGMVKGKLKVTGVNKNALELLCRAVLDAGGTPPASDHIPRSVKVVPIKLWREYCRQGTVADSDDPKNQDRAFRRAVAKLQADHLIGVWNDLVWPVEAPRG
jgi:hypothetical protein